MAAHEDLCMYGTQGRIFYGYGWRRRSFAILNYVRHFFTGEVLFLKFYFIVLGKNGGDFFFREMMYFDNCVPLNFAKNTVRD